MEEALVKDKKKLGEILMQKNLVSNEQLEQIIAKQTLAKQTQCQKLGQKRVGELLLEEGLISSQDLNLALQEQKFRSLGLWVIG